MQIFSMAAVLAAVQSAQVQAPQSAIAQASPQVALALGASQRTPAQAPPPSTGSSGAGQASAPVMQAFGVKDSWRWQLLGSWMGNFEGADQLEMEWSASWFFMQNVSLDFGLSGDAILQPGLDAGGGGASLMLRWHFLARADWSVYGDIGCGMLFTNEPVPSDGGRVNFTPRAGVGGTLAIGGSARLMGGLRWYHISNANTGEDNPGRDSLQVYGGVSFPF
ncbi:MAG: acyloxyacyl hydrolase [Phycisphaerales bacterium]|jgi:hypothetical protein